ncbi:MAG: DUF1810 domain-containing protein [Myxococcota bacterium]|nr:DUF1810 domain-containing protein [Myxococcota bacterium]
MPPFDLGRFHDAQNQPHDGVADALRELRAGRKKSHWIWYVFPQLRGLGSSPMAVRYGLEGPGEGAAYLADRVLAERLAETAGAVRAHLQPQLGRPAALDLVMGSRIDAQKLVSSMTLFAELARRLGNDERPDLRALAEHAEAILGLAEAQGYPRCELTERALRGC